MRSGLLFSLLLCCLSRSSLAQKEFTVLDWKGEATLNAYLVQELHRQYRDREVALARAFTSPRALKAYQLSVRDRFRKLLGPMPPAGQLNARVTGTLKGDGYRIEKVVYQSFPGHHVTASLYLPGGKGPFPAALFFCGHEDAAKATGSYQKTAALFARNGFVVLVVDPISQGERHQLVDHEGKPRTRGGTTEHTLLNAASNLLGTSVPAYELWDNVRSLDYLVTRREVDTARIGCLGNSGGAMQTLYFAAFDPRIKVLAPNSYLATRQRTLELTGPADGCAQIPGEGAARLEFSDYLIAAAPKPLLVMAGRYDFIDYTGTLVAMAELQQVYHVLGQPKKVRLFTYDDGHGLSQPKREAVVTWFRQWLYGDPRPVREGVLPVFSDKELFATHTGSVSAAFPGEVTITARNAYLADSLAVSRTTWQWKGVDAIRRQAAILLALPTGPARVQADTVGVVKKDGYTFQKIILRCAGEPPLPVLVLHPPAAPGGVVLWLQEDGKGRAADSGALARSCLERGLVLVLADLRGMGETEDKPLFNDPKYYNREYRNAMLALHLGKPLVGQRTTDIASLLRMIRQSPGWSTLPVELHATGAAAVPALHAGLLAGEGVSLHLHQSIRSFYDMLQRPLTRDWYSYVVPGVLQYYDLPDLVQLIGEQRVFYIDSYPPTNRTR